VALVDIHGCVACIEKPGGLGRIGVGDTDTAASEEWPIVDHKRFG
jgi:hypothetical protein